MYRTANRTSDEGYRLAVLNVAGQARSVISGTRRVVNTLLAAAGPELAGAECEHRLARTAEVNGQYSAIAVVSANGIHCGTGKLAEFDQFARGSLLSPLASSPPASGAAAATQRADTVLVGRGPLGPRVAVSVQASETTVLAVVIDPAWWSKSITDVSPAAGGTVAIVDNGGQIVGAAGDESPSPAWLPPAPEALARPDSLGLTEADSQDGRAFVYSSEPVDAALTAIAGFPRISFGPAERQLAIGLVFPFLLFVIVLAVAWVAIDRLFLHWIRRLDATARRLAFGDFNVRAELPEDAPLELRQYANAFDQMTQVLGTRTRELATVAQQRSALLRELHHRVKNNFQVIASFLNLMKRERSGEARQALAFAESRVHAMAAAYKLALAQGDIRLVSVPDVIEDVVAYVQHAAGLPGNTITLRQHDNGAFLDLDHAIPLALLLVETLWPLLMAPLASRVGLTVEVKELAGAMSLVITAPAHTEEIRTGRFQKAFLDQIGAAPLLGVAAVLAVTMPTQEAAA
ncbi:sensor histidine kinase [Chelatococcus reniformis]|uniref:sensor histidine kinase n=1 Tax=Chelatococcus reniformis TaxID=1494448 RepID=UPI00188D6D9A|nr:sensor histidine kinase [Chelatococcus reniformis]